VARLKLTDPAARAMSDFRREPVPQIAEELELPQALDMMFRQGVRASLVVREGRVTGLLAADQPRPTRLAAVQARTLASAQRAPRTLRSIAPTDSVHHLPGPLRVADAMTPAADLPAIDWQVIEDSQVRDLVEIFEGSGAHHLVVLENDSANCASIRGLVQRDRLERALGARWAASLATRRGIAS
jgi:hypothetical protein